MGIKKIYEGLTRWLLLDVVGKVTWKLKHGLTDEDKAMLREKLKADYYVILTRRSNHLSTYFTAIGHFLLTGKLGFWSHALMNLEDEVHSDSDFRLIEAVSAGVTYTPFEHVFDVDAVVLLKPKRVTLDDWRVAMDGSKEYLGRKYDTLFDLAHDNKLSCVEVVKSAMSKIPGYKVLFADFDEKVTRRGNLTPQMYYDCDDFEVILEIRRPTKPSGLGAGGFTSTL